MIIYQIKNLKNGKIYIGQTTSSLEERWRQHCSRISDLKRTNALSAAMRKYGKNNFEIKEIAQTSSQEELNKLEFKLALELNSYSPYGYNLKECGDGRGKQHPSSILKRCKKYEIINPFGETFEVLNLKKFCKNHGLDYCHMYKVCNGSRSSHKGWISKRSWKNPTLTNGVVTESISGVYGSFREFCRKYNLKSDSGIHQVVSGKIKSYRKWKLLEQ